MTDSYFRLMQRNSSSYSDFVAGISSFDAPIDVTGRNLAPLSQIASSASMHAFDALPIQLNILFLVITIIMAISASLMFRNSVKFQGDATFHYLAFLSVSVSTISYFAMYTGIGVKIGPTGTLIYWPRYAAWMVTGPMMLLCTSWLAKCSTKTVIGLISLDMIMVLCWVCGVMTSDGWGKITCWGVAALLNLAITWQLLREAARVNFRNMRGTSGIEVLCYLVAGGLAMYPIVWLLGGEGFQLVPTSIELMLYAVADVYTTVGVGMYLMLSVIPNTDAALYITMEEPDEEVMDLPYSVYDYN